MSGNKVFGNSIIYSGISILQKGIYFLLLPLYTAFLTTTDLGVIAVVTSIANVLSILFGLALTASANRYYYEYKNNEEKVQALFGTLFSFLVLYSFSFSLIFILLNKFFLVPFAKGIAFFPYLLLSIIISFFSVTYSLFQSTLQAKQQGKLYGLNNISYFLINVVSTIILLVVFNLHANSVLISIAGTNIIFFIYSYFKFASHLQLKIKKEYLVPSLKYSLPLVPHSIASWLMVMVNNILLNNIAGTSFVGIYSVGFQIGNILNLITGSVNQAFVPWFFENFKAGNKIQIIKYSEILVLFYCLIATAISLFGKEVLQFMVSKNFEDSWRIVPPICFTFVFSGLYYFFSAPLFYNTRTTKYIPLITISGALVNIVLNFLLIPRYNIMGAALSCLISTAVSAVIAQLVSLKLEWIEYKWRRMYLTVILCGFLSLIAYLEINAFLLIFIKLAVIFSISIFALLNYKSDIYKTFSLLWLRNK